MLCKGSMGQQSTTLQFVCEGLVPTSGRTTFLNISSNKQIKKFPSLHLSFKSSQPITSGIETTKQKTKKNWNQKAAAQRGWLLNSN